MQAFGSTEGWRMELEPFVGALILMVGESWDGMPSPAADAKEDAITRSLCAAIRKSPQRCDIPFRVELQREDLNDETSEVLGKVDIVFLPFDTRDAVYFGLECKRLNVTGPGGFRPYASEYVTEGMMRFVRGQYGRSVSDGAMVGYVLDGDVPSAMRRVEANLVSRCGELGMTSPASFANSTQCPDEAWVRETAHERNASLWRIRVHHLFLAGQSSA